MERFGQFKTKFLMLFLISGILVLSISFIFISCGYGPQIKAILANKGAYAIDMNDPNSDYVGVVTVTSNELPDLTGKEFTIEAWVKSNVGSGLNGGIFSRYDSKGIVMWVKGNKPKFAIRHLAVIDSTTTSTDYIVDSGVNMTENTWYHIAGVLVNEDHSTVTGHPTCVDINGNASGGEAETPHLDIYVNGTIQACARTGGNTGDLPAEAQFASVGDNFDVLAIGKLNYALNPKLDCDYTPPDFKPICAESDQPDSGLDNSNRFDGVIDEVRFWIEARTASQIQTWMTQEINVENWYQANPNNALSGYWRFNEGQGTSIVDASGNGFSGSLFSALWVAGDWP